MFRAHSVEFCFEWIIIKKGERYLSLWNMNTCVPCERMGYEKTDSIINLILHKWFDVVTVNAYMQLPNFVQIEIDFLTTNIYFINTVITISVPRTRVFEHSHGWNENSNFRLVLSCSSFMIYSHAKSHAIDLIFDFNIPNKPLQILMDVIDFFYRCPTPLSSYFIHSISSFGCVRSREKRVIDRKKTLINDCDNDDTRQPSKRLNEIHLMIIIISVSSLWDGILCVPKL